jgi:hypothetical protein
MRTITSFLVAIFVISLVVQVSGQNVGDKEMIDRAQVKAYYFGQMMPEFNFTIRFGMRPYVSDAGPSRSEFNRYITKTCTQVLVKQTVKIDCENDKLPTTWEYLCNCMPSNFELKVIQITTSVLDNVFQVLVELGRVLGNN